MNIRQKKWKYFASFSCGDPGSSSGDLKNDDIIKFFHLYDFNFDRILTEDSFPKLLLMMAIAGIDANEVNFNKVSMLNDVEKALAGNKISHLQYSHDGSEPTWVTYNE